MGVTAIILAGGKGLRMGYDVPKQFMCIGYSNSEDWPCRPILMHTIYHVSKVADRIVLVLPSDYIDYWNTLVEKYNFDIPVILQSGGQERFHSVALGLTHVDSSDIVLIHDGVRPFISTSKIKKLIDSAQKNGAAIPYLDVVDSLRYVDKKNNNHVCREKYKRIQTPQVFQAHLIKSAYQVEYTNLFTDDAVVYEMKWHKSVALVKGDEKNIKITQSLDILLAQSIINLYQNKQ